MCNTTVKWPWYKNSFFSSVQEGIRERFLLDRFANKNWAYKINKFSLFGCRIIGWGKIPTKVWLKWLWCAFSVPGHIWGRFGLIVLFWNETIFLVTSRELFQGNLLYEPFITCCSRWQYDISGGREALRDGNVLEEAKIILNLEKFKVKINYWEIHSLIP